MKSKSSRVLAVAWIAATSMRAFAADPLNVKVDFRLKPAGARADFETTLTIDYPAGVTLDQVDRALHDPHSLEAMSTVVTQVRIVKETGGTYLVKTRGTGEVLGFDVHKWTHSRCSTTRSAGRFVQGCKMVTSGGDTGELFEHGGSRNTCVQKADRVTCAHQGWGQVKQIKKLFKVVRSAPRLAIGGAAQLIQDFSSLGLMLQGVPFPTVAARNLDSWSLKRRLYDESRAHVENGHLTSGKWLVVRGDNGGAFRLTEE